MIDLINKALSALVKPDTLKVLGFIGGNIVGLWTLLRGIREYTLKNRLDRYKQFIDQRKEFEATPILTNILGELLDEPRRDVSHISSWERIYFLVFMENIAIMMNSRLLSSNVVHNTWGNVILKCYENDSFWRGIDEHRNSNQRSPYWRVFYQLCEDMKLIDSRVRERPGRTRRYQF